MESEIVIETVGSSCRLCLTKSFVLEDILSIERMSEKLQTFLQIEVKTDDRWPLVMCGTCVAKIDEWEAFYNLVRSNEKILDSIASRDVVLEVDTHRVKNEVDTGDGEYTVVCIRDDYMSKLDDENVEEIIEEDEEEEGQEYIEFEATSSSLELKDDDVSAVQEREAKSRKKPGSTKRGRPKKSLMPNTPLYITREQEDEMIRDTLALDCDHCFENYDTFENLLLHYRVKHNDKNGYVKCCDKVFKRRYVLVEHVRLHLNPNAYSCEICLKQFTTKRHLSDHILGHIPKEEQEFQCEKCPKRYASASRLQIHMKTHNEQLSFTCRLCQKAFRQESILKNHIKTVHEMSNQHVCEVCAKVFKTKEGFQIHKVEHMETPPERLKCEICGGKYKNRDSLKYHMLRHKRADERYYCDVCNKEFNCKKRMRSHRKYVHATSNELFQCKMCDKAFKRPIVLKEHMAAHLGQLLYTCAYCPKQFNSNANKYSHQKAQHPVEWELARQRKLAG